MKIFLRSYRVFAVLLLLASAVVLTSCGAEEGEEEPVIIDESYIAAELRNGMNSSFRNSVDTCSVTVSKDKYRVSLHLSPPVTSSNFGRASNKAVQIIKALSEAGDLTFERLVIYLNEGTGHTLLTWNTADFITGTLLRMTEPTLYQVTLEELLAQDAPEAELPPEPEPEPDAEAEPGSETEPPPDGETEQEDGQEQGEPADPVTHDTAPPGQSTSGQIADRDLVYVAEGSNTIHAISECTALGDYTAMTLAEAVAFTNRYCQMCARTLYG